MESQTRGGWAAIAGAVLAIAGNAVVLTATPAVPEQWVSHPLPVAGFRAGQVFFAVTQALMAYGIVTLVRARIAGPGRAARLFGFSAVAGWILTVPGELALIPVAAADVNSAAASAASSVFGLGVLLGDAGLIGLGVLALRRRHRPMPSRLLPLALGLFQLLVVTPVAFSAGFASLAAFVVITLSDLLVAGLGLALIRYAGAVRAAELSPARV